jgi:hypothetical protein
MATSLQPSSRSPEAIGRFGRRAAGTIGTMAILLLPAVAVVAWLSVYPFPGGSIAER